MKQLILFYIVVMAYLVNSEETKTEVEEGRGKAKYALLSKSITFYILFTRNALFLQFHLV